MDSLKKNTQIVFKEILAMPDDEFHKVLEQHKNGDIANALMESGSLQKSVLRD